MLKALDYVANIDNIQIIEQRGWFGPRYNEVIFPRIFPELK